jgi:outer membrane protein OmpA-like peptidoglycan-associated protein
MLGDGPHVPAHRRPGSLVRVSISSPQLFAVTAIAAVLASGCTNALQSQPSEPSTSSTSGTSGTPTEPGPPTEAPSGPGSTPGPPTDACRPGPGKQIEELPDITTPPIVQPGLTVADQTLGGVRIPGVDIAPVELPAQVIDGGCIVRYDAPAGCLGAVEITGFTIPAIDLPGYTIPGYSVAGQAAADKVVPPVRIEAQTQPGARVDQVCQQQPSSNSRFIASVFRPPIYRNFGYRTLLYREGGYRSGAYTKDGQIPSLTVPGLSVPSVSVPAARVGSATIDSVTLPDAEGTEVFSGEGKTVYSTQADVLFDFGQAEVKPAAVATLRRIAADLRVRIPNGTVQIDGHTDAVGGDAENLVLSTRRAEAVKQWLSSEGAVPADRIRTRGYGETAPVAPNAAADGTDDPAGRTKNRRVVISATG